MEFLNELQTAQFWAGLWQIILINIVLSGDNAVVIALAARSLPARQQKQAVMWGAGAAVVMRIVLTIIAVEMLKVAVVEADRRGAAAVDRREALDAGGGRRGRRQLQR
jgi:predicted tellurium resistance membrane protein TerC